MVLAQLSHKVAVKMLPWTVVSSEGSSGAGNSLSGWGTLLAVGRGLSFSSMGPYEWPLAMTTDFPQNK